MILEPKGLEQVGSMTSAVRAILVTVEFAVNACEDSIPPMFVFPSLKYRDFFLHDDPLESIDSGNGTGWLTATKLLIFLDHFIKYIKSSGTESVLIHSHVGIEVVQNAKDNEIILF